MTPRCKAAPTGAARKRDAPRRWRRGTRGALVPAMTVRARWCSLVLAASSASTPAFAQTPPAGRRADAGSRRRRHGRVRQGPRRAVRQHGGLTADQAAARAAQRVADGAAQGRRGRSRDRAGASRPSCSACRRSARKPRTAQQLSEIPPFMLAARRPWCFTIAFLTHSYDAQANAHRRRCPTTCCAIPKLVDAAQLGRGRRDASAASPPRSTPARTRASRTTSGCARSSKCSIAQRQLAQVQATLDAGARAGRRRSGCRRPTSCASSRRRPRPSRRVDQLQNLAQLREEQLRLLIGARDDEPLALGEDIRTDSRAPPAPAARRRGERRDRAAPRRARARRRHRREGRKQTRRRDARTCYPKLSAFGVVDDARPEPARSSRRPTSSRARGRSALQLTWTLNDTLVARRTSKRLDRRGRRAARRSREPRPRRRASRCCRRSRRCSSRSTRSRRRRRASPPRRRATACAGAARRRARDRGRARRRRDRPDARSDRRAQRARRSPRRDRAARPRARRRRREVAESVEHLSGSPYTALRAKPPRIALDRLAGSMHRSGRHACASVLVLTRSPPSPPAARNRRTPRRRREGAAGAAGQGRDGRGRRGADRRTSSR